MKRILAISALLIAGALSVMAQTTISLTLSRYNEARERYAFVNPFLNHQDDLANTLKEATFLGEETEFICRDSEGQNRSIFILGTKGIVKNTKGGIMWGGAPTDYMKFPAIPGKELVKVEIRSGKDSAKTVPMIVKEDGSAIEGGDTVKAPVTFDQELVWDLKGLGAGNAAKLVFKTAAFYGVRTLKLTYK